MLHWITSLVRLVLVESDVPSIVCCVLFCKKHSIYDSLLEIVLPNIETTPFLHHSIK